MLLTDSVSILALLGFCICWVRVGMARRDAILWASVSVALLASIAGYANSRGVAMIALVVALVLLLGLVIRRLRGSRVLGRTPWVSGVQFSRYRENVVPHDAGRVRDWWNSLSETERAELPSGPDVAMEAYPHAR